MKKLLLLTCAVGLITFLVAQQTPQLARGGGSGTVTTNFTTINVTNIFATNITAVTITSTTNIVNVHKGGMAIFTNSVSILSLLTNILATDATGLITNVVVGTGLSYDTSTRTLTATGGGGSGVSTAVTALGLSSTNVTGFDCTTNNMSYTLTLADHYLFGSSTFVNVPNTTTNLFFTLALKQDNSGGWIPKFTNTVVTWADGFQPFIKTQANAVSYIYFHSHLFTNGMLVGSANINVQ